ncbi:MAG: TolC family protein [Bacteroidales bacterium]|nr:TolC family protein [Bacteroidales bacterium]
MRTGSGIMVFLAVISLMPLWGQDTLTLTECHRLVVTNWPLARKTGMIQAADGLTRQKLNRSYLPELQVNGQVSWQSDVTKVPVQPLPGIDIPIMPKDWYKISLDINQVVYDGAATRFRKEAESLVSQIDLQQVEVGIYELKERINELYFRTLLLLEKKEILLIVKQELENRLSVIEAGVENGIMLATEADILRAELISNRQEIRDTEISAGAVRSALEVLCGGKIQEGTIFQVPFTDLSGDESSLKRPEYRLFDLRRNHLASLQKLQSASRYPRLMAFGQGGYGRPALDMLLNEFDTYYMVGARFTWTLLDRDQSHKEGQLLGIRGEMVDTERAAFELNQKIEMENLAAEINRIGEMLRSDEEILQIREKVTATASSQLDNGVITSSEYLTELHAGTRARLNLELHRLQLEYVKIQYLTLLGNI